MQWRSDFAANLADGYALDGSMEPHDERSSVSASGSMDTSIEDQARLWAGDPARRGPERRGPRGDVATAGAHHLAAPVSRRWLTEPGPDNAAVGLAAGLGLVTFRDATGPAWFKGGHNDWTGNFVICLERPRRCVVLLANDVRAERVYPELVRFILGPTQMPWQWEYDWVQDQ